MSSCPGLTLEEFLAWQFNLVVEDQDEANTSLGIAEALGTAVSRRPFFTKAQFAPIVALFENHRADIENKLFDFDEEDHGSWRDYSGHAFDSYVTDELSEQAMKYITDVVKNPSSDLTSVMMDKKGMLLYLFKQKIDFVKPTYDHITTTDLQLPLAIGWSLKRDTPDAEFVAVSVNGDRVTRSDVENYEKSLLISFHELHPETKSSQPAVSGKTMEFITQELIAPFRAMASREISEKMRVTKNISDAIAALAVHGKYDSESQEEFAMSSVSSLLRETLSLVTPQVIDFLTGNGPIAKQLKQSLAMAKLFAKPEDAERIQQFEQELDVKFNYRPMIGTALQNIEWKSILGVIIDLQNKYLLEDVPNELFTEVQASEPIEKTGLYISEAMGKAIYMILDVNEIPITIIITKDAEPVIRVVHKWENQELFIFNICYFPGMYKALLEQLEAFPKLH